MGALHWVKSTSCWPLYFEQIADGWWFWVLNSRKWHPTEAHSYVSTNLVSDFRPRGSFGVGCKLATSPLKRRILSPPLEHRLLDATHFEFSPKGSTAVYSLFHYSSCFDSKSPSAPCTKIHAAPCCLRRLIIQPTIIRPVRVHKARECARAAERRTFVFAFNISVFLKHFEAFFWHEKSLAVHTSALLARNENAGWVALVIVLVTYFSASDWVFQKCARPRHPSLSVGLCKCLCSTDSALFVDVDWRNR